ncbi:MAG: hypothetical protein IAE92_10660 [Burkholderiaceae bacterium]|nr:hypothetical protein [Burkholderiaceae bacterium]
MSLISDLIGGVLSLALRIVLALMAAVFAVSLLLAGLFVVVFLVLRGLITGQKAAPTMVWQQYRQASQQRWTRRPGAAPGPGQRAADPADVVDVTPRDITPR